MVAGEGTDFFPPADKIPHHRKSLSLLATFPRRQCVPAKIQIQVFLLKKWIKIFPTVIDFLYLSRRKYMISAGKIPDASKNNPVVKKTLRILYSATKGVQAGGF